uniref:Uncharacterized protein n=1 Tax=Panagrolaimus superbus TaxID=310955 RepID=A0A914XTV8_9BILA
MVDEFDFDAPKSATFFEEKENEPFVLNKNASSASRISNLNSSKSRQNCNGLYSSRVNSNLCTNHNQNDEYAKPPTITSSSTESSSRQLSSTLQSNRSPELFHPDISEIQNASLKPEKNISTTLNGSSSSTLFYHSNLYKDLNLDESSKAMALKYLNSPRTNEKKADISERSSKLLDSLKARSNNNAAVKPQPEKPHQFSLNSLVDHFSSFTRPTTPTSKKSSRNCH